MYSIRIRFRGCQSFVRRRNGFSLVEVVLALAIASFALLAIFALVYVAQQSGKASSDDTRLSQITQQLYHQIQIELATDAAFKNPPSWTALTGGAFQRYYYFDVQGTPLPSATATTPGVIYQATATLGILAAPSAAFTSPTYPFNTDSSILKSLVIKINWPPPFTATGNSRIYPLLLRDRGSYGNSPIYTPPYP